MVSNEVSKLFIIVTPGAARTGGPEALHQLAHELNALKGVKAFTLYVSGRAPETIKYYQESYNIYETTKSEMPGANIVVPECFDPGLFNIPPGGSKWVWWLAAHKKFPLDRYRDCGHLFQSEYARHQAAKIGFSGYMLSDYLNESFNSNPTSKRKKNLVVFNGSKSALEAARLKLAFPKLPLVPIRRLKPKQVAALLNEAKIYLDLGHHPGRDRMPREAAILNCLVVTGLEGTASNDIDIPIPMTYKVDNSDIFLVGKFLLQLLKEFPKRCKDFDEYRNWIKHQKTIFQREVRQFAEVAHLPICQQSKSEKELITSLDAYFLETQHKLDQLRKISLDLTINVESAFSLGSLKNKILPQVNSGLNILIRSIKRRFRQ